MIVTRSVLFAREGELLSDEAAKILAALTLIL